MNLEMEAEPVGEQLEVSRVVLQHSDLNNEEWTEKWKDQDKYIDMLESRLREVEEKGRGEVSRREQLLVMRLTGKEQELQEMAAQIAELKAAQAPSSAQLRQTSLDPAVNLMIQKLTKECDSLRMKIKRHQVMTNLSRKRVRRSLRTVN